MSTMGDGQVVHRSILPYGTTLNLFGFAKTGGAVLVAAVQYLSTGSMQHAACHASR